MKRWPDACAPARPGTWSGTASGLVRGDGMNAAIAWAYVLLRIAHSIVQATFNRIAVRFVIFGLSTLALDALILHAAMAVF